MLTLQERVARRTDVDAEIVLAFEFRQRSRFLTVTMGGEEAGIQLERGGLLRGGDCLGAADGRVVRIVAASEALCEVRGDDTTLARCAYHLGNRHAPVEVGVGYLRFATDDVLANMVRGLGAAVEALNAPFEPEAGAYAGGHLHHPSVGRHSGIIHDMITRTQGAA